MLYVVIKHHTDIADSLYNKQYTIRSSKYGHHLRWDTVKAHVEPEPHQEHLKLVFKII